jgi:hypothetical protein
LFENASPVVGSRTGVSFVRASHPTLDVKIRNCDEMNRTIHVNQDIDGGIGAVVWDCVILIFNYVLNC